MIAFVKNEKRAKDFAIEILEKDLKLNSKDFLIKIQKVFNNKFKITLTKK